MKNGKGDSAAKKTKKAQVKSIVRREKEERVTEIFFFDVAYERIINSLFTLRFLPRESVDPRQFLVRKGRVLQRPQVVRNLGRRTGPDDDRRDAPVGQ